jgi:hypothetical protein
MNVPPPLPGNRKAELATARNAFLLNQFATPGLGSLLARRWAAGTGQLLVACAGFLMIMSWFIRVLINYYSLIGGATPPPQPYTLAIAGAVTFAVSWFWSLATSISILREAGRSPAPQS